MINTNMDNYISHDHGMAKGISSQDLNPVIMGPKMPGVIRGIYNRQGFYSALNFIIKSGLVVGSSQEEAELSLRCFLDG